MKTTTTIVRIMVCLAAVFSLVPKATACDACGCSMSGNYSGIYPQFHKNIIGFAYRYQAFRHPSTELNLNGSSVVKRDRFHSYELTGRFFLSPRVQLLAAVPYAVHTREESERTTQISGVGDMAFTTNLTIVNTGDSLGRRFRHTLLGGVGLSLPTGKYQQRDETRTMLPAQFQIGTGAYRFSLRGNYTVRYQGAGINAEASYTFNGKNERAYAFGNQYGGAANAFYWFKASGVSILPSVGFAYEFYQRDAAFDAPKLQTGGSLQLLNAGVDVYLNNYYVQLFVQEPLRQQLPDAQPSSRGRLRVGISRVF